MPELRKFRVDIRVDASVYVEAEDEDQARQLVLSPNADDLVQHDSFFADGVRIDSVHESSWPHRNLTKHDDIVDIAEFQEDEDDDE